jgi:hypothetical protein
MHQYLIRFKLATNPIFAVYSSQGTLVYLKHLEPAQSLQTLRDQLDRVEGEAKDFKLTALIHSWNLLQFVLCQQ